MKKLDIVKAPNIRTKKSAFTIQLRRYKCSIINRLSYMVIVFWIIIVVSLYFYFRLIDFLTLLELI